MNIEIIYEDKDIAVLNKPAGLSVHPPLNGRREGEKFLTDWLSEEFPEMGAVGDEPNLRPGLVHRLDKNTSGVMVVVRNQDAFETLKNIFKNRLVEKTYWAVVCGRPKAKEGSINSPIGRLIKNPLKRGVETDKIKIRGAREAVTAFRVLRAGGEYSLMELKPKTGRMHQIRVHLKALGYPVACDDVYGGKKVCCPPGAERQLLHARSISFSLKPGRRFYFEADPPEDFRVAEEHIL